MKRWIFENFNLKVLAVFIAFLLWSYVDLKQVLDHKHLTLYVELTDIPTGMDVGSSGEDLRVGHVDWKKRERFGSG